MPKPADQEGEEQIPAMAERSFAAAAQRDIYIIPEPCGKGNMPTAPEFPDAMGKIRAFKVLLEFYPEKLGAADSNVRIS